MKQASQAMLLKLHKPRGKHLADDVTKCIVRPESLSLEGQHITLASGFTELVGDRTTASGRVHTSPYLVHCETTPAPPVTYLGLHLFALTCVLSLQFETPTYPSGGAQASRANGRPPSRRAWRGSSCPR